MAPTHGAFPRSCFSNLPSPAGALHLGDQQAETKKLEKANLQLFMVGS